MTIRSLFMSLLFLFACLAGTSEFMNAGNYGQAATTIGTLNRTQEVAAMTNDIVSALNAVLTSSNPASAAYNFLVAIYNALRVLLSFPFLFLSAVGDIITLVPFFPAWLNGLIGIAVTVAVVFEIIGIATGGKVYGVP